MKKLLFVASAIALSIFSFITFALPASAATSNLILNPSFETSINGQPTNWSQGGWGTNTTTFSYTSSTAHTGSMSATVNVSNYVSGDAKWYADPVSITPSASYTYSDYYISNVATRVVAAFTDTNNVTSYTELAGAPAASSWSAYTTKFIAPASVKSVVIYHLIDRNGNLSIDDVDLSLTTAPTPPPPVTSTNLILNPSVETSTNGTTPDSWSQGGWGSNTSSYSYQNIGQSGSKSLYIQVSNYVSGDAKWYNTPVAVTAGAAYTYTDYYQSNVSTDIVAAYTNTSGQTSYVALGSVAASSTWAQSTVSLTPPANTVNVSIYHLIAANGWLRTDNFSLIKDTTTTPPPTTSNLVPNQSLETVASGAPASWLHDKWGSNTATFAYVTNDGHTGTHSAKVTISKYVSGDAKWYFKPISNVSGGSEYAFSMWYKTNTQPDAVVMYTDATGTAQYMTIPRPFPAANSATTWTNYTTTFYLPKGATSATVLMLISSNGWLQVDDYNMVPHIPVGFNRPIVSLTFDDGLASTYNNGLPLLNKYGFISTQFIATGLLNTSGYMTDAMVASYKTQGSEIGSHTVTHAALTTVSSSQLTQELSLSQSTLRSKFGSDVAVDFATPEGDYNQTVINAIKTYYQSHRSVDVGYNSKDSFDPYNIRVQNILLSTTPAEVSSWVAQAIKDKTWLVIVYHGVDNGGDAYSVTPTNFANEMSALQATGVSVQTISQALAEIKAQL